jgi:hypothetical protein
MTEKHPEAKASVRGGIGGSRGVSCSGFRGYSSAPLCFGQATLTTGLCHSHIVAVVVVVVVCLGATVGRQHTHALQHLRDGEAL